MRTNSFNSPVHVEDPETGLDKTVSTVRQAKAVLDRNWPDYHGSRYEHAEEVCEAALHGNAEPLAAKQAFIAAAVEAHLKIS